MNITLIGMPAVGKSTVGVILAKAMKMDFLDTDIVIQNQTCMLLRDIISKSGVDKFIKVENIVLSNIECNNSIISTGGSAVYGEQAMLHLKDISTVVYLRASYDTIKSRLKNMEHRGVVIRQGQTLRDLYNERSILYEKYADITIDITTNIRNTVNKVMEILKNYKK